MKRYLLLLFTLLVHPHLQGQKYEKVHIESSGSDHNYYLKVMPSGEQVQAVLLLLAGFGQKPETIFEESTLPSEAGKDGILVICVGAGSTLWLDSDSEKFLKRVIRDVVSRHSEAQHLKWVIGGFSAGGSLALRITEKLNTASVPLISLAGVFTVDSPVDLIHIYDYMNREMARNYSEVGYQEAMYISQLMEENIGTPDQDSLTYAQLTPFDLRLTKPGNESNLRSIAVRTYHDVDVSWLLENRRRSVRDANYYPSSELINRLLQMGNNQAEFIQSKTPGMRSNGERHPHSWSIIDTEDCLGWIHNICTIR